MIMVITVVERYKVTFLRVYKLVKLLRIRFVATRGQSIYKKQHNTKFVRS